MSYILPVILFSYNNIFFVMVIGFVFYYLIFKRWFRFIEIESTTAYENETESRSDSSTKFCSSPDCVRCTLYRSTILLAKDRLLEIKPGNEEVVKKVEEAFITLPLDRSSTFSQNPNVFFYHELQSAPFWETEIFDDSRILESNFNTILSEFQNIVHNKQTGVWKRNETPSGAWEVFHLVNQGTRVEQNSQLCPETMSIISALSSAMTRNVFGNVTFSVIHPSTVISEHYGPTNIRLRCHLGKVYSVKSNFLYFLSFLLVLLFHVLIEGNKK